MTAVKELSDGEAMDMHNAWAIIVAGGSGLRMGHATPKQFLPLSGKPILWHSVNSFLKAGNGIHLVIVLPETEKVRNREVMAWFEDASRISIVHGGATRFQSVKNGLQVVPEQSIVLIHDAVRCLVTGELIRRSFREAGVHGNAIPAVAVNDSIRRQTPAGSEIVDRSLLRAIQTPQAFQTKLLKKAFEQTYDDSFTDDAGVLERIGEKIHLIEGEVTNIKITRPIDLMIAEQILLSRRI